MADEAKSPILKIRTFADDIKRAGGGTSEDISALPSDGPVIQSMPPRTPIPASVAVATQKPTQSPPQRKPQPQGDGLYHPPQNNTNDDTEEIRQGIGVATILNERPAREDRSAITQIKKAIVSWWKEMVFREKEEEHDPFAQSSYPAIPVAEAMPPHKKIPLQQGVSIQQTPRTTPYNTSHESGTGLRPSNEIIPVAVSHSELPVPLPHSTEHIPPTPSTPPPTKPLPTNAKNPSWRRISEPRENDPLSYTSEDELAKYKAILQAGLPPISPTEKQSLKSAPQPVRQPPQIVIAVAPQHIPPQTIVQTVVPQNTPEVRLQNLVRPESEQTERLNRDIPFVPPAPLETPTSPLRTYRNDAITDVQTRDLSRQQIAATERIRRDATGIPMTAPRTSSTTVLPQILAAFVVVLCIGLAGTYWYLHRGSTPVTVSTGVFSSAYFSTDKTIDIPLGTDRIALLKKLAEGRAQTTLASGQTAHLRITKTEAQGTVDALSEEIMRVVNPRAPNDFLRTLSPKIMFGVTGQKQEPFLVLKVSSYDTAFAGMLKWEEYLSIDLSPFFGEAVRRTYDPSSLTADHTRPAHFVDDVIQNTDVRILYDAAGEERLVYSFIDQETIVITTSHTSLLSLMGRLR